MEISWVLGQWELCEHLASLRYSTHASYGWIFLSAAVVLLPLNHWDFLAVTVGRVSSLPSVLSLWMFPSLLLQPLDIFELGMGKWVQRGPQALSEMLWALQLEPQYFLMAVCLSFVLRIIWLCKMTVIYNVTCYTWGKYLQLTGKFRCVFYFL